MPCMLSAENSGFYGAVGFQYSNMTKATGSNSGSPQGPLFVPGRNAYSVEPMTNGNITLPGQGSANSSIFTPNPSSKLQLP
ncbi:hypothetical protein [Helicobacter labacensis]|uniref:hypothetical protein n=1 Tax=Helicobacter labacensis TaxID=2316079 RepID=UPI0013CE0728|nr:hypothetical protein [Helicobacter labacensis]